MSAVSPQLPAKLEKRWNIWVFRPIISAYNRIKNNSCMNMLIIRRIMKLNSPKTLCALSIEKLTFQT